MTTLLFFAQTTPSLDVRLLPSGSGFGTSVPWMVALLAVAASAAVGFYNYQFNWRIKRMEYLEKISEALREKPELVAATQLLDWEIRADVKIGEVVFRYNVKMLEKALVDHRVIMDAWFTDAEVAIRETFDAFFNFLESASYAVRIGLLRQEDLFASPLHYYLGKVLEKDRWTKCVICRFLEAYGFPHALELLRAYAQSPEGERAITVAEYPASVLADWPSQEVAMAAAKPEVLPDVTAVAKELGELLAAAARLATAAQKAAEERT